MLIGYASAPTTDQNLDDQVRALHETGAEKIFQDEISGAGMGRPG
jgi:DNA invertase Pin-like site-specific DNA recombinase